MTFTLVLGGGGITGAAWEAGILKGLRDAGIDLSGADVVIGTSAGAVVGAAITTGGLDAFWERQIGSVDRLVERPATMDQTTLLAALRDAGMASQAPGDTSAPVMSHLGRAQAAGQVTGSNLARLGQSAIAAVVDFSEEERLRTMASRIGSKEWPDRDLMITAVDCADGSLKVWTKESGVPLVAAVASSCAAPFVYPPATINGRRYMDGGIKSDTNVNLAQGTQQVVVVKAVGRNSPLSGSFEADVEALEAAGARIAIIDPDPATAELLRTGPVDPANRRPAAEAGLKQSAEMVRAIPTWVTKL